MKIHFEIVKTCLERGLNVFCEKPLTSKPSECQYLYDLADNAGVKLYVDDVFNYRKEVGELKSTINHNDKIEVTWDSPNNTDYKNLMYHDLYLLYDILCDTLIVDWPYINNVKFNYNISEQKQHIVAGVDFTHKEDGSDALYDMIEKVLNNEVDYDHNKKITLNCCRILNSIRT
ncbi:MAG: Gfo/Idh/MocA family oxidoreductase [Candidatus Ranarchaeia archaeon]